MIRSMTGFGRGEYKSEDREIVVSIRSVNHRYRDISTKIPRRYSFAEEKVKSLVKEYVTRGKIELSFNIESLGEDEAQVKLDIALAKQYYNNMRELQKTFDLTGDISLETLATMHEVMKTTGEVEDEEGFISDVLKACQDALEKYNEMRETEGAKLSDDIQMRIAVLKDILSKIEKSAPQVALAYEKKLQERMEELLEGDIEIAKERIVMEVALFADKSNIDEELVRLKSHFSQLEKILKSKEESNGKKIDFLVQEMNREANTIGSKANDIDITNNVLDMKSEIEKIREQVQNIE